jgi:hypothetical protein
MNKRGLVAVAQLWGMVAVCVAGFALLIYATPDKYMPLLPVVLGVVALAAISIRTYMEGKE